MFEVAQDVLLREGQECYAAERVVDNEHEYNGEREFIDIQRDGFDHILQWGLPFDDIKQVVWLEKFVHDVAQQREHDVEYLLHEIVVRDDWHNVDAFLIKPVGLVVELRFAADQVVVEHVFFAPGAFEPEYFIFARLTLNQKLIFHCRIQITFDFVIIHPFRFVVSSLVLSIQHNHFMPILLHGCNWVSFLPDEEQEETSNSLEHSEGCFELLVPRRGLHILTIVFTHIFEARP